MMKLEPIQSNMTELNIGNLSILFSYKTPVAIKCQQNYYKTAKKWSNTTTRHVNKWLAGAPARIVEQSYFDEAMNDEFRLIPAVFYGD